MLSTIQTDRSVSSTPRTAIVFSTHGLPNASRYYPTYTRNTVQETLAAIEDASCTARGRASWDPLGTTHAVESH